MSTQVDVLAVLDAAAEWRGDFMGDFTSAAELKAAHTAVSALIAERAAMRELVAAAEKVKRAYWLARNSAAGLTNYCEESGSTRRCERELAEAERIYRDSGFEAALALATGESA